MNFEQLAQRFARSEAGTDAFKAFYRDAYELMKGDPANAGLYFVVGIAAQSYVRTYEDQGVTAEVADKAKATLEGYNAKLVQALSATPAERLRLLGEVALDYEWQVANF